MKTKDVATVVVVKENKVLVLKRGPKSSGAGLWNFPGGSVETGEEFNIAAIRELKEETNLEVYSNDLEYFFTKNTKYLDIHFFITDSFEDIVKINSESSDSKWVSLAELAQLPFVGGGTISKEILKGIKNYMEKTNK